VSIISFLCIKFTLRSTIASTLSTLTSSFQEDHLPPPPPHRHHHIPNPHMAWCPKAECFNSPMCQPCQRRFLMVITNGRSASTTLTWMLDLLPGVRMAGENNNALYHIKTMMDSIFQGTTSMMLDTSNETDPYSAWYHHPILPGTLSCASQKIIETIIPPPSLKNYQYPSTHEGQESQSKQYEQRDEEEEGEMILGFKTIRLLNTIPIKKIPQVVKFLSEHFPCTRYIVNHRSGVREQAESWLRRFGGKDKTRFGNAAAENKTRVDEMVRKLNRDTQWLLEFANVMRREGRIGGNDTDEDSGGGSGGSGDMEKEKDMEESDRVIVVDSSVWTKDIEELNRVVRWLGFDEDTCRFDRLLASNTIDGYSSPRWMKTTSPILLSPQCRYIGGGNFTRPQLGYEATA